MKNICRFFCSQIFLAFIVIALPVLSHAAEMNDYCVVPPFVGENVPSNLLLMIDNSSSMYDLTYSDQGNTDASGNITRQPYYCYDETYQSAKVYTGYFNSTVFYRYDFTNNSFTPTPSLPASCTATIANALCVHIAQDATTKALSVDYFAASGNYLNWLASSKFDVEKQILTGGKVVSQICSGTDRSCNSNADCATGQSCTPVANPFLQGESRGCLGQSFIKTPLNTDFVNFTTTDSNTQLGISFGIRGPVNPNNPSAPSRGGQGYIDIYNGTYNNQVCQTAVNDYYDTSINQATLRDAVQACLNFNPKNYCSRDPSRTNVYTCSRDSDCLYTANVPTPGNCSSIDPTVNGRTCYGDNDCSKYIPGGCSNAPVGVTMSCNTNTASTDCYIPAGQGRCGAGPSAGQGCWGDIDCGSTTNPGTCSNTGLACTSSDGCTVYSTAGGCTNNPPASNACSTIADCTVATTLGHCSGYNSAQACTANATCQSTFSCTNTDSSGNYINCTSTGNNGCAAGVISAGKCNNATATTCTSNANCSGPAVNSGTCDNHAASCSTDTDCTYTVTNSGICSGNGSGHACTTNSDCSSYVIPLSGYCSKQKGSSYVACTYDVDCGISGDSVGGPYKYGTCSNPTPSASTCTAPLPTVSTGTCTNTSASTCSALLPNPSTSGTCQANTCVGAVINTGTCTNPIPVSGGTGVCNNVSTTQNHCNSPDPTPTSTGTCTNPVPSSQIIGTCDGYSSTTTTDYGPCIILDTSATVKTKISLTETVQTCWTYLTGGQAIGTGDYTRLIGGHAKCDDVYAAWGLCQNDSTLTCTVDADCPSGKGLCNHGPATIKPGNAAYACSLQYLGTYCTPTEWNSSSSQQGCTWDTSNATAIETTYENFCNAQDPTVIDPTDSASANANYEQLPALLGGIGAEAQLGMPIGTLAVRLNIDPIAQPKGPSGLIQQYADRLRIGAMSFNFNGSKTEAASGTAITLPRVCSNDDTMLCNQDADCGSGNICRDADASKGYNLDGGHILYPIGLGTCATLTQAICKTNANCAFGNTCINGFCGAMNSTVCTTDSNCATGDTCITKGAGTHSEGLINAIDSIRANAWTPFAEAFYDAIGYFARTSSGTSRTDMMLNSIDTTSTDFSSYATVPKDFNPNLNPSQFKCQQNYVMLITDGSTTADQHPSVQALAGTYSATAAPSSPAPTNWNSTCSYYAGSTYLPILSWLAKKRNIADFSLATQNGRDSITTYVVSTGSNANGLAATDECNPQKLLADTAANGGTTLKQANNPQQLYSSLQTVFQELAARSASGTAASILSNSEGSGANILQAIFFPRKVFDNNTQAFWIGEMNSLWYYVDPFIGKSSMREDTNQDNTLELTQDYVVQFFFDPIAGQTRVNLWQDTDGDGAGDTPAASSISPDALKSLWKAGKQLWERDVRLQQRAIYTPCTINGNTIAGGTCNPGTPGLMRFNFGTYPAAGTPDSVTTTPDNSSALQWYLQAADIPTAKKVMKYVHGFDYPGDTTMRSRTVQIGSVPAATLDDPLYTSNPQDKGIGVWKLGDIISSTPRTQSTVRQNAYNLAAPNGYADSSYGNDNAKKGYIYTSDDYSTSDGPTQAYLNRGVVYAGVNDGMLHAFNLGTLKVVDSDDTKAQLQNPYTGPPNLPTPPNLTTPPNLGHELWAFMPTNILPYLNYYADPYYSHLYFMDGSTKIVDASVASCSGSTNYWDCSKKDGSGHWITAGSNWRSILVGGMGIGGASRNIADTCADGVGGTCVKTPLDGVGYSSYYALDVSDPRSPAFMWEFSDAAIAADSNAVLPADMGLGFATSGTAIVRISARDASNNPDKTKNGRWFAVFGSGPTGPIDTSANHRFMGTSNQLLKVYVVDLKSTPPFKKGVNYWVISDVYQGATKTSLPNAFAGSLVNGNFDADRWNPSAPGNYQDDAVYFGYTQQTQVSGLWTGPWTSGGVLKLVTFEDPNPAHWRLVKVFDGTGPVTSAVARLQDPKNHHLWLYFGTGRYYYLKDDFDTPRQLFGIKDACYRINDTLDPSCATMHSSGDEINETSINSSTNEVGWSITLRGKSTTDPNNIFGAERNISDPTALTNGAVFFTTYKPNNDLCQYGGRTYMWGVKYDTGTTVGASSLVGKVLIQVSTGEFKQVDLATALDDMGGRAMADPGMTGKGSNDSSVFITNSNNKPVKRIMHIQEH